MTEKKTYRLASSGLVNSHGMVRWALNGYRFPGDRANMTKIVGDTWNVPRDAVKALLSETVPFTVEGTDEMPVVVFTA